MAVNVYKSIKTFHLYGEFLKIKSIFAYQKKMDMGKDINRIKVLLAEKKRTNKWLAKELGKDPGTVSKWCTNTMQPNLETLVEIAKCLDVDTKDLLWSIK